jgi:hypothetical protein
MPSGSIPAPKAGCPTSRSFFARCGIPRASPSSCRGSHRSVGVPHVRTSVRGPKMMGEAPPQPFVPDHTLCHPDRSAAQWRDLRCAARPPRICLTQRLTFLKQATLPLSSRPKRSAVEGPAVRLAASSNLSHPAADLPKAKRSTLCHPDRSAAK